MKQFVGSVALWGLLGSVAPVCAWAASDATVMGVVRDVHGTPQMGALVELLTPDATIVARAFTDDHGRYLLKTALPGSYQLRASAAFLAPALHQELRLRDGARSVANLTMTAIFDAANWLPTEKRSTAEPADDWKWTLRSSASRPLLRVVGPSSNDPNGSSSSEEHRRTSTSRGQIAFLAGDGSFGQGGNHQEVTVDRAAADGDVSILKANLGDAQPGSGSSVVVSAGLQHQRAWGGGTRLFVSFASHPELQSGAASGLQVFRSVGTQKVVLGDLVQVDAGTLFTAERLLGTRANSAPYVRVAVHPASGVALEYRLATDRMLQSSEDLDRLSLPEEAMVDATGHPELRKRVHQEFAVVESDDQGELTLAVFHDGKGLDAVQGSGVVSQGDVAALPILSDPTTDTLRYAVLCPAGSGARVSWTVSLTKALSATMDGAVGTALEINRSQMALGEVSSQTHSRTAAAMGGKLEMRAKRTGTVVDVGYRWQQGRTLTQVDPYDAALNDAYLGVKFRQKLWSGRRLRRVSAVVEASNLLAEGYTPVLAADGQTVFLAQVPRSIQGGLAFSF